jgi:hypothetical protein
MSVLPLTTIFTPPASCLAGNEIWQIYQSCMDGDTTVTSKVCNYLELGPPDTTSCFPSSYNPSTTAYYSPGRCPEGYTSACGTTIISGSVTETADTCCPTYVYSHFKLKCLPKYLKICLCALLLSNRLGNFSCQVSPSTRYPWQTTLGCLSAFSTPSTFFATASSSGSTSKIALTAEPIDQMNAYAIRVRYQSTDFVTLSTTVSE